MPRSSAGKTNPNYATPPRGRAVEKMNINITTPCLNVPHGGLRIIMEWANRLSGRGHDVHLQVLAGPTSCSWFPISPEVGVSNNPRLGADTTILTSPHSSHLIPNVKNPILFLQMLEHLFRPGDKRWEKRCFEFYRSKAPMFSISRWNMDYLKKEHGRTSDNTFYIGNGVNTFHFPISEAPKDFKTVLVEGWHVGNPSKDLNRVAPRAAKILKERGYRIIAYGSQPLQDFQDVPHEYYLRPSLAKMNDLYRRATILLKASQFDARSCAPVEAATKGTVTVRAILQGDDDLTPLNSVLVNYNYGARLLANSALDLLEDKGRFARLSNAARGHVGKTFTWPYWMDKIEERIKLIVKK